MRLIKNEARCNGQPMDGLTMDGSRAWQWTAYDGLDGTARQWTACDGRARARWTARTGLAMDGLRWIGWDGLAMDWMAMDGNGSMDSSRWIGWDGATMDSLRWTAAGDGQGLTAMDGRARTGLAMDGLQWIRLD